MISRRTLILTPLLVPICARAAKAALPIPPRRELAFRIRRNGEAVGMHVLRFTGDEVALDIAIEIDIAVSLGPITVYRYHHRGTESWRDGRFFGMQSKTDDDGTDAYFDAARTAEGMVVNGSKTARYIAPEGVLPTTYWNRAILQNHVINSQDGRLFDVSVTSVGTEQVLGATGKIDAAHFQLRGDLPIDLWYDSNGHWAYLEFTKRSSRITYEKL
jgi:hypothetical protein